MRKLILFIATSLDGYIAGPNGEIDWLFTDQDYGYSEFYASIDTVVMGRKTYDVSLSFAEYPYPGRQALVFSRTRHGERDDHATFVSGDISRFVRTLKFQPGRNIWLVGGGEIIRPLLQDDLIDESRIFVHPIVLGAGVPLFPAPLSMKRLNFRDCHAFDTGLVRLTYER
ncbi:MAG TPA: dihydrofolate reductase family protein [Burkholderiales bacterium]|jgi:dihydrofolate reductase|nr:dihydrofolate reductase family protein [Burkholderiales bacterium]